MDCKTARLLLDFQRPGSGELDAAEAASLEEHLAACPDCGIAARAERGIDEVLGQAMRRVEIPDRLRTRLLVRLAADHAQSGRRRRGHLVRVVTAIAAMLIAAIGFSWWLNRLPVLDRNSLEAFWEEKKADRVNPPDADEIRGRFKRMGVETVPPRSFRYSYLTFVGLGEFQGQLVPQMVFVREGNTEIRSAQAQVLILSPRQFNLDQLQGDWQSEEGYPYRARAVRYPSMPQVYVVFHTGEDFDWLVSRDKL